MRRFALYIAVSALLVSALSAQDLAGTWQGTMEEGPHQQARTLVKIAKSNGGVLNGTLYRIDDGVGPIPIELTTVQGKTVKFSVGAMGVTYEGKISPDGDSIAGVWVHGSTTHPLTLMHVTDAAAWEIPSPRVEPRPMPADADPGFEVATIKPSAPNGPGENFGFEGRHFTTTHTTVNDLIAFAYGLHAHQIVGAPAWFASDPYDISGVPDEAGEPNLKQYRDMIQKLLADRLQLKFHHEQRELAVYTITVRKSGPKLKPSTVGPNDEYGFSFRGKRGLLAVRNLTMAEFAIEMQGVVMDKPVVDHTGLTGRYDFNLDWTPDDSQFLQQHAAGAPFPLPVNDPNAPPALSTAMQEQLGLKLEAVKAPDDVMVIDHVERPSPN